jgi:hypothetical protein
MEIEAKRESPNAELPEAAAFLKVCPPIPEFGLAQTFKRASASRLELFHNRLRKINLNLFLHFPVCPLS